MIDSRKPFPGLTRRSFIKTTAGLIACCVTGLPQVARADIPANALAQVGRNGSPVPGIAAERIDGRAKVTGQKVFARDFNARDMPGWPAQQWYALFLYALTTDHAFLGLDLAGLPDAARPRRVILGNQLGRQVAVIVENGLSGGEAMIKLAREFGIQQKVIGHEGGHSLAPYESAR